MLREAPRALAALLLAWLAMAYAAVPGAQPPHAASDDFREINGFQNRSLSTAQPRLNVLMVIIDDLRPETGSYGSNNARTPNMDALAAESVQFNRAYSQQALCGPSRGSFLTGRFPSSLNYFVHTNPEQERGILDSNLVLPQYFAAQGYEVHGTSKLVHWVTNNRRYVQRYMNQPVLTDNGCGGRVVCDDDAAEAELTDARAVSWARRRMRSFAAGRGSRTSDGKPWMLMVGFRRPHTKFRAPRRIFERFKKLSEVSLPPDVERGIPASAPWQAHRDMCTDLLWSDEVSRTAFRSGVSPILDDDPTRALRRGYFACVEWVDELLGELLGELDELGMRQDTLVVVTSDHGWQLGEHGSWCKGTVYDRALRVPLWIRDPLAGREDSGRKVEQIVQLVDLFPTVAELAGVPLSADKLSERALDGRSFAHLVRQGEPTQPEIEETMLRAGDLAGRPWSWPASAAFSFWPVCTVGAGSREQVNCKSCVDLDNRGREVECSDCADGLVRNCGQEVRSIAFLGLSVRTEEFRYSLWLPWINGKEKPDWDGGRGDWGRKSGAANDVVAEELYMHSDDGFGGQRDGAETLNLADSQQFAATRLEHYRMLRARFVPCEASSEKACDEQGAHCTWMAGSRTCVDRGFCGFSAESDCRVRSEACSWNGAAGRCESNLQGTNTRQIVLPTKEPSVAPSQRPTTESPTHRPTEAPQTPFPSLAPSARPTTSRPTAYPSTSRPTAYPSSPRPTNAPQTPRPSHAPTPAPTGNIRFCKRQKPWRCEQRGCKVARGIGCRPVYFCGFKNRFTQGNKDGCDSNPDYCVWDVVENECLHLEHA